MRNADSRGASGAGIFPLRHEHYDKTGWDLDLRSCLLAYSIKDRKLGTGDLGHWVFNKDTLGDIVGALCWPAASRPMPGWSWVWPTVLGGTSNSAPPTATPGGGGQPTPTPTQGGGGQPTTPPPVATGSSNSSSDSASGGGAAQLADPKLDFAPAPPGGGGGGAANNSVPLVYLNPATPLNNPNPQAGGGYNGVINPFGSGSTYNPAGGAGVGGLAPGQRLGVNFGDPLAGTGIGGLSPGQQIGVNFGNPLAGTGFGFGQGFTTFVQPGSPPGTPAPGRGPGLGLGAPNTGPANAPGVQVGGAGAQVPGQNGPGQQGGGAAGLADPLLALDNSADATQGQAAGPSCGLFSQGDAQLLPVKDALWSPDDRYKTIQPNPPPLWPKVSKGTYGLTVCATDETQQVELFFPCMPGVLVAINYAGDPKCGSLVYDQTKNFNLDKDRGAPLQSIFWVLKKPNGENNAIAFNLGPSGCTDVEGGWFIDRQLGAGGVDQSTTRVIGRGSVTVGGPFDVGDDSDKHAVGKDADGHKINTLHLSTRALFRKNNGKDGPIRFEDAYQQGEDKTVVVPCHLAWTGTDWAIYTTTDFQPDIAPVDPYILLPDKPRPFEVPGDIIRPMRPGVASVDTIKPNGTSSGMGGAVGVATMMSMVNLVSAAAIATAATISKPLNYSNTGNDISSNISGAIGGSGPPVATVDPRAAHKYSNTPAAGGMSSFGSEGGKVGSGASSPYSGAGGDPWVFTQKPNTGKYKNGTMNGGWVIHPPETDLRDARTNGMVPPNTSISTTYFITAPGAYFGCGVPELNNGSIKDGASWGVDATTGDFVLRTHSGSAAAVEAFRITKTSQNIEWKASTANYGIITHNNSANRTYTFPDKSGTVALLSDVGAAPFFKSTADGSTTGIGTNISIVGSGTGSQTLAANALVVGSVVRITARGYYTTGAAPGNLTVSVVCGASVIVGTGAQAFSANRTNAYWELTFSFIVRTTGGAGTLQPSGDFLHMEVTGVGSPVSWPLFLTGTTAVSTTSSNLIDVVTTMSANGNTITCTQCVMEQL